jgi:tripartite-type tricarboxylate transporter receptor subunit TctC
MKKFSATLLAASLAATAACVGAAQKDPAASRFPERPVRFIVGQAPGGNADFVARLLAAELGKRLGQQFVVDNRAGASGIIATELAVRAPPDGHTLLLVSSTFAVNPSIYKKLPYDPLKDLTPLTLAGNAPNIVVVNLGLPVHSIKDLIQLAREKPGYLNYGSSGVAGSTHLAGELFDLMAGTKMVHVPFKGAAAALVALMGGQTHVGFASMPSAIGHVRSGKLRAIAVTGLKRSNTVPELPTVSESGLPGFETGAWQGIFAPARTPPAIVKLIHSEIAAAVQQPDVRKVFTMEGGEPIASPPHEFAAWLRAEIAKWAKVVKAANITVE